MNPEKELSPTLLFLPCCCTFLAKGFITRPLGALVVGRIGDKYGRKTALVVSMYLMCIPTTLIGCLPTFDMVGIAAPILLVLIRAAQVSHVHCQQGQEDASRP